MKLKEIAAEASRLSEEERASLASQLLHGLEPPVYTVSDEQIDRRVQEGEADPNVMLTFDELVAGLRHRGDRSEVRGRRSEGREREKTAVNDCREQTG